MDTVTERPLFNGHGETLACLTCNGRGSHGFEGSQKCDDCDGLAYVECCNCGDGTAADIVLAEGQGAFCLACFPGSFHYELALANPAAWIERATDAGRGPDGDPGLTQELKAIADDPTEPQVRIYEYVPPKCPANDDRLTVVDMPAVCL